MKFTDWFKNKLRDELKQSEALTLNEFFYSEYYPHILARKEKPQYDEGIFRNHFHKTLGTKTFESLNKKTLEQWLQNQLSTGIKKTTINKHICLINKILKTASEWGQFENFNSVVHNLNPLRTGQLTQRFLSEEEIAVVLELCSHSKHPFLKYFVELLLLTGARSGEASNALWRDIDFTNAIWTVPKSKSGKTRFIYLNEPALELFVSIQKQAADIGLSTSKNCPVFTNPHTQKPYKGFHLAWYEVRKAAGLDDVRIHDLRHTYASLLVNKGVSLYEVQQLLGHSSPQMTQRYAHFANKTLLTRSGIVGDMIVSAKQTAVQSAHSKEAQPLAV